MNATFSVEMVAKDPLAITNLLKELDKQVKKFLDAVEAKEYSGTTKTKIAVHVNTETSIFYNVLSRTITYNLEDNPALVRMISKL